MQERDEHSENEKVCWVNSFGNEVRGTWVEKRLGRVNDKKQKKMNSRLIKMTFYKASRSLKRNQLLCYFFNEKLIFLVTDSRKYMPLKIDFFQTLKRVGALQWNGILDPSIANVGLNIASDLISRGANETPGRHVEYRFPVRNTLGL